ncbi:unnamed protein product [Calypogeia fissa]
MEEEAVGKRKAAPRIDPAWEFTAPKYHDFLVQETEDERISAELWFAKTMCYDASPHAGKSKPVAELLNLETQDEDMEEVSENTSPHQNKENLSDVRTMSSATPAGKLQPAVSNDVQDCTSSPGVDRPDNGLTLGHLVFSSAYSLNHVSPASSAKSHHEAEGGSPSTPRATQNGGLKIADRRPFSVMSATPSSPGSLPAKRLHLEVQVSHPATMPPKPQQQPSSNLRPRAHTTAKKKEPTKQALSQRFRAPFSPEDPANKKQKLEGGRLRQIKERFVRPNDAPPALTKPQEFKFCTQKRSRCAVEVSTTAQLGRQVSPFVSMAEKVRSFQCKTPERFHFNSSSHHEVDEHEKRRMKLTKPKTPEFETSHRTRQAKVKSTAELEAEMLAKVPRFKARPAPRKILEAPPAPVVQKSAPQMPEFQEFHFRTTERALQHKGTTGADQKLQNDQTSVATSTDSQSVADLKQRRKSAPGSKQLSEPRDPHLHTAERARPIAVKSTEEMELEELAKVPKFKARPFNKRILESKGELGLLRTIKREPTKPQEFHFATDERLQHKDLQQRELVPLEQMFSKLSFQQPAPQAPSLRPTVPEPFNLETENRGLLKGMRFLQEILEREEEEMEARVPRAHPLPFTTDVPDIPRKPEPKPCTQPEPFQLESLVRHEEELERIAEERKQAYELEASLKAFRAQPNLSSMVPVFVPQRSRKPLTEVHEFTFHLETRAAERADFDQRVAEKHNQYKRFREEYEAARKAEEDRSIKAMRREMVPHARPMPVFHRPFVPQRSTKELTRPVSPQFNLPPTRMPSSARRRSLSISMASMRRKMGR